MEPRIVYTRIVMEAAVSRWQYETQKRRMASQPCFEHVHTRFVYSDVGIQRTLTHHVFLQSITRESYQQRKCRIRFKNRPLTFSKNGRLLCAYANC